MWTISKIQCVNVNVGIVQPHVYFPLIQSLHILHFALCSFKQFLDYTPKVFLICLTKFIKIQVNKQAELDKYWYFPRILVLFSVCGNWSLPLPMHKSHICNFPKEGNKSKLTSTFFQGYCHNVNVTSSGKVMKIGVIFLSAVIHTRIYINQN